MATFENWIRPLKMCLSVCYNYATAELSCSIFEQKPNVKFAVSDVSIEWPQNEWIFRCRHIWFACILQTRKWGKRVIRLTLIYAYTFCLKGCNWSALFVCTVYYGPIVLTNRSFQPDAPNLNSDLSTIMQKTVKSIAYTTINFSTKIQSNLIRTVFEMTWIALQFFTVVSGHFDKTVSINYYLQFTVVDSVLLNGLKRSMNGLFVFVLRIWSFQWNSVVFLASALKIECFFLYRR